MFLQAKRACKKVDARVTNKSKRYDAKEEESSGEEKVFTPQEEFGKEV